MRVLVAEQQPSLLRALQRCLQEDGFGVDVASENQEADSRGRTSSYDLIVLSLALGGNQGLSLLRSWRQTGVRCPILTLASANNVAERVLCLNMGADDYLCRPFQLVEFKAHVGALMRRVYGVPDTVVCVRDLEIDTSTQTVRRAGRAVHLTRREYSLLQLLAFHRGQVVNQSLIWEHLYGESNENSSNVVSSFILSLRRKIDKGFDVPLILTRYGKGYLLRGDDQEA